MSDITITKLQSKDWRRYKSIRLEALRESPDSFGSTYEQVVKRPDDFWRDGLTDGSKVFAQVGDELASMAGVMYEENDDGVLTAYIIGVYTRPEFRKQGLSRLVMASLIKDITDAGRVQTIELHVNKDAIGAIKLYESLGFVVGDHVPDYVRANGQTFPQYRMKLRLKQSNSMAREA